MSEWDEEIQRVEIKRGAGEPRGEWCLGVFVPTYDSWRLLTLSHIGRLIVPTRRHT